MNDQARHKAERTDEPELNITPEDAKVFYTSKTAQDNVAAGVCAGIKKLIEERKLTLDEVAEKLGLKNRSAVSHITTGKTRPGLLHLMNLCTLLDVDPKTILYPHQAAADSTHADKTDLLARYEANLEAARAIIKREWPKLDADRGITLAMQVAKNLGGTAAREEQIRQAINDVISQHLKL